jgi:hypothetical protein
MVTPVGGEQNPAVGGIDRTLRVEHVGQAKSQIVHVKFARFVKVANTQSEMAQPADLEWPLQPNPAYVISILVHVDAPTLYAV